MIIRCGLLLLALNCVGTTKHAFDFAYSDGGAMHFRQSYSNWPSMYTGAKIMRVRKREAQESPVQPSVQNEGGPLVPQGSSANTQAADNTSVIVPPVSFETKNEKGDVKHEVSHKDSAISPAQTALSSNSTVTSPPVNVTETNNTNSNSTNMEGAVNPLNINNPGVVKRATIVFGGFLLLAVAYFIFYRRKGDKNNANSNGMGDANQFRYGVLESEDPRGKMELSRVPLTMESDEEDDEDLEIFDLGRKTSQSYVNLQSKDEDLVFNSSENQKDEKDTLLLEIEDGPSDTVVNWSNNTNKSIL